MKMNGIIVFVFCLAYPSFSFCQFDSTYKVDSIIPGAYRNAMDFNNNRVLYENEFLFTFNTIQFSAGTYEVTSTNPKIKSKDIKYSIWIIYDGEYLYLNGTRQGVKSGYIKIDKLNRIKCE